MSTWTRLRGATLTFIDNFTRHDVMTLSAALAFYTSLSLAPLLLITLSVLAIIGWEAQNQLIAQVQWVIGQNAGDAVLAVIEGASERADLSKLGGLIGIVTLIFTASGVFAQIQASLNQIWDVKAPEKASWKVWIGRRLLSMGMVLSLGFVSMVSLLVTTALSFVFGESEGTLWGIVNLVVSLGVFSLLFGLLYKVLPDRKLPWREALIGGLITSVLFTGGKELIGLYLASSAVASAYGAAGSLMLFLVWVYYSSLILFVGCEISVLLFTKAPKPRAT